jgi:hypothetical protein
MLFAMGFALNGMTEKLPFTGLAVLTILAVAYYSASPEEKNTIGKVAWRSPPT